MILEGGTMNYQLTPVTKGDVLLTLYTTIDDLVQQAPTPKHRGPGGRPTILSDAELVTALVYAIGLAGTKTIKAAYNLLTNSHRRDFPDTPTYEGFLLHVHRVAPLLWWVLGQLCQPQASDHLRLVDATKVPVCKNIRAKGHKVAAGVADWGKTGEGWFFGFKLHLAVNEHGALRVALLTPGNVSDRTQLDRLFKGFKGVGVGDGGYLIHPTVHQSFWGKGIWLLTGVRKNMCKLMTRWQHGLLKVRQRIEGVNDYLKEHLNLVTSFPRSVVGYLVHYLSVLVAYQLHAALGVF